jgi:hypothetical protein
MKTALDTELFPNKCEVIFLSLHNQWIYCIQKNGNSSLHAQQAQDGLAVFVNEQIRELECVDIYIRNPRARYVSGVNTYLQQLMRDTQELDYNTAFWFAKRYKFLNSHYLPQFHWIANLSKYLNKTTKLRFRDFKDFASVVDFQERAGINPPSAEFVTELLDNNPGIDLWLHLDRVLLNLVGQQLTWDELLEHYKSNHQEIIKHVLS